MTNTDPPVRLRDVLPAAGARMGVDQAVAVGRLHSSWRALVGDAVAEHAEPVSLREGILKVRVASPTWATEVAFLAPQIRGKVNEVIAPGLVREIRVYTAPLGNHGEPRTLPPQPPVAMAERRGGDDPRSGLAKAHNAWLRRRSAPRR